MDIKIPKHIAFIMDGNGRWAKKKLLPRKAGHREGVMAMRRVIDICGNYGVEIVSFYAFSTENWSRPKEEIKALFSMVKSFAKKEIPKLASDNIVVRFMGDLSRLPEDVREAIEISTSQCEGNTGLIINIGINYGGRDEIVYAVNKLIASGVTSVDIPTLNNALYTGDLCDPDIMVRSSGEVRLSNFMLWQLAYSEFIFRDELWPDFDKKIIDEILVEYSTRDRRYGKVKLC